jgi:hypothetical protein
MRNDECSFSFLITYHTENKSSLNYWFNIMLSKVCSTRRQKERKTKQERKITTKMHTLVLSWSYTPTGRFMFMLTNAQKTNWLILEYANINCFLSFFFIQYVFMLLTFHRSANSYRSHHLLLDCSALLVVNILLWFRLLVVINILLNESNDFTTRIHQMHRTNRAKIKCVRYFHRYSRLYRKQSKLDR